MGRRGFKSADELMVLGPGVSRPDAPYSLTDAEAEIWRMICASMEPEYFRPSHYAALSQLCRHTVASNYVSHLVSAQYTKRKVDRSELASLLQMQASESNAIIRLMRQLRLSHQAIYRGELVKNRPLKNIDVPWNRSRTNEDEPEDQE